MTTESDSPLTGADYDLANAGYVPMPDPKQKRERETIGSDTASLREVTERCADISEDSVIRRYTGADGEPAPPHEAVTLARASRDYAGATAAERLSAEGETSGAFAERVDALRAQALDNDPGAAELYGVEADGETSADAEGQHADGKASHRQDDAVVPGLDPELERALQHPQVRHAIEEQLGEAERTRQSYLEGLAAATQVAQASFLGQFPELATVTPENLPFALAQLSQQDPDKFERVRTMVAAADQLLAQQQVESDRQAELGRQAFNGYARAEDARFEAMMQIEATDEELAEVLADMHQATFLDRAPVPSFDEGHWWLAFHEGRPVEFAGVILSTHFANAGYFCRVGVLPEHRGHRLQLRLMRALEARARFNGWCSIVSDTTDNFRSANNFIGAGYRLFIPTCPWGWSNTLYWRKDTTAAGRRLGTSPRRGSSGFSRLRLAS